MPASIRRDIGQLLIGSLPGDDHSPPSCDRSRASSQLGGVILFARNIEAPEQVAELSHDVQALAAELPLWVSVDQEGGRVARLRAPFTEWPPMATLGRSGDAALAARFAAALAAELRAVGITLDYAPVLDIHTNPKNPIIGDRALAEDAETVARARRGDHPRAAGQRRRRLRQALSRDTATRRSIRTSSCRSSSIRPTASAASSACRSARRSRPAWRSS